MTDSDGPVVQSSDRMDVDPEPMDVVDCTNDDISKSQSEEISMEADVESKSSEPGAGLTAADRPTSPTQDLSSSCAPAAIPGPTSVVNSVDVNSIPAPSASSVKHPPSNIPTSVLSESSNIPSTSPVCSIIETKSSAALAIAATNTAASVAATLTEVASSSSSVCSSSTTDTVTSSEIIPSKVKETTQLPVTVPSNLKVLPSSSDSVPSKVRVLPPLAKSTPDKVKLLPTATESLPSKVKVMPTETDTTPSNIVTMSSSIETVPSNIKVTKVKVLPAQSEAVPSKIKVLQSSAESAESVPSSDQAKLIASPAVKEEPSSNQSASASSHPATASDLIVSESSPRKEEGSPPESNSDGPGTSMEVDNSQDGKSILPCDLSSPRSIDNQSPITELPNNSLEENPTEPTQHIAEANDSSLDKDSQPLDDESNLEKIPESVQVMSQGSQVDIGKERVVTSGQPATEVRPVFSDDAVSDNNVISIPESADLSGLVPGDQISVGNLGSLKLEDGGRIQVSQGFTLPSHITVSGGNTILINQNNLLAAAMAGNITGDIITTSSGSQVVRVPSSTPAVKTEAQNSGLLTCKPPNTEILLKTAKEVLQLSDDPMEYRRVFPGGMIENVTVDGEGNILSTNPDQQEISITDEVSQMEVTDENGTYILESVNGGEFYEDPNIMWIEETVEVEQESYENLPNMVIILNPNGTVNEELMLANGMNMETIKAVTDAATGGLNLQNVVPVSSAPSSTTSITSLQHPIPKKLLTGVTPMVSSAPRTIIESATPEMKYLETQRSVILDPKDDYLVLDDIKDPMLTSEGGLKQPVTRIININGTQHLITSSKPLPELRKINSSVQNILSNGLNVTPLGTLDLSLPKKVESGALDQYVNPSALVPENTVLKVLEPKRNTVTKIRRQRMRDENGNGSPYIQRKTTSLGALGQALHGIPRDSRENAVQICPICKFQATTKNPYRHLQDHLARVHFKERIAAELPTKKPYICPFDGCDGKQYPDWQAVMRHYIGKKHGILDKYVKEELSIMQRENGGRIAGTIIRPGVELHL